MGALLWLFAHGAWVWRGAIVIAALAAFVRAVWSRRAVAAKRAAARRSPLGTPIREASELHEGPALVAGRLSAGEPVGDVAATSLSYRAEIPGSDAVWEPMADARAERLAVVVGDTEIPITGPVSVVIGSREGPWRRAPEPSRAMSEALEPWAHRVDRLAISERTLSAHDHVWVRGTLERDAGSEPASYRDHAASFRFVQSEEPVTLAFAGVPRQLASRAPISYLGQALGAGLVVLAIFGFAGEIANLRLRERIDVERRQIGLDMPGVAWLAAINAVSPFHRDRALRDLTDAVETHGGEDVETRDLLVALRWGRGMYVDEAREHLGRGAIEQCGTHAKAPEAWYAAGDFEHASRTFEALGAEPLDGYDPDWVERARFGVRVHLLAGRADVAAVEARRLAAAVRGPRHSKTHLVYDDKRARDGLCIAEAIEARSGSEAARRSLGGAASDPEHRLCTILYADLLNGADRVAFVEAMSRGMKGPDSWMELLATEADPARPRVPSSAALSEPGRLASDPGFMLRLTIPALEMSIAASLIPRLKDSPLHAHAVMRASATAAALSAIAGDTASAARFAAAMREAVPDVRDAFGMFEARGVAELDAVLALLAGDEKAFLERAKPPLSPIVEGIVAARARGETEPLAALTDLFGAASSLHTRVRLDGADRDGARLAALLRHPPRHFARDWDAAAEALRMLRILAPGLRVQTGEVTRWLHGGKRLSMWPSPALQRMIAWSDLAAGARAVGDTELAITFQRRAAVFHAALSKREWAAPLAVLEQL